MGPNSYLLRLLQTNSGPP